MAENKGVLPSSNVNTLGNANNKWENVYAKKFTGALTGNASTASSAAQLTTARSINGTNFNGTGNITTANWGTARNISIADATATNTGTGVSVNGSGNVTLKLPATIKASLTGNVTGNVSGSSGSCTGNAATATKATQDSAGQQINTTYIKGLSVSGTNIIYTKGNNSTGSINIQGTINNMEKMVDIDVVDINRLISIGATCIAKNANIKVPTGSSTDWLMSANFNNSYNYWINNGYVTLSQSWRNFKYITIVTANTYEALRNLVFTTVDTTKLIALDNYFKSHIGDASNSNTKAYPWCEPWITTPVYYGVVYALFTLPFYDGRYPEISSTKIVIYTNDDTGILYIYGHNSL